MFPGGADPTKDSQSPLGSVSSNLSVEQRIQKWMDLRDAGAPMEQIQAAEIDVAEAMKQSPFEVAQGLPFFQQMAKKLDATQAFQQFRLPGRDIVVADRRDEHDQGKPAEASKEAAKQTIRDDARRIAEHDKKDAASELRMQDGKLVAKRQRDFVNHLGDRTNFAKPGHLDQQVASDRVDRMLSAFERMVVARFEDGAKVAHELKDGKARFLEKSDGQWRDFFKSFIDRTIQKKALFSEIKEFLYRGVVNKGMKGIFIGDINFQSGKIEKFVRFSILAEALSKLKSLQPGMMVGKGVLAGFSGEELMYLALAVSRGRELGLSMLPTQGKFLGGRAEAEAAQALGLPIDQHLRQKAKALRHKRGGGAGKGLFDDAGGSDEVPYQFVPWWSWGNLKRPGRARRTTAIFYGALLVMAIIGIVAMTMRLLHGV